MVVTRSISLFFATACIVGVAAPAFADSLGAAKGVAFDNVLKRECSRFYRVNPTEIAAMNFMMRETFGKDDPEFDARVRLETTALRAKLTAAGAQSWCFEQKAKLESIGARKLFR